MQVPPVPETYFACHKVRHLFFKASMWDVGGELNDEAAFHSSTASRTGRGVRMRLLKEYAWSLVSRMSPRTPSSAFAKFVSVNLMCRKSAKFLLQKRRSISSSNGAPGGVGGKLMIDSVIGSGARCAAYSRAASGTCSKCNNRNRES